MNTRKAPLMMAAFAALSVVHAAPPAETENDKLFLTNTQFLNEQVTGNLAEIMLGQLAQRRGATPFTRQFGAMMVREHTAANQQLRKIAWGFGAKLPTTIDPIHRAIYDRLSNMSGAAFDEAYRMCQIMDHEATYFKLTMYRVNDEKLQDYAAKSAPKVMNHLTMLRSRSMTLPMSSAMR